MIFQSWVLSTPVQTPDFVQPLWNPKRAKKADFFEKRTALGPSSSVLNHMALGLVVNSGRELKVGLLKHGKISFTELIIFSIQHFRSKSTLAKRKPQGHPCAKNYSDRSSGHRVMGLKMPKFAEKSSFSKNSRVFFLLKISPSAEVVHTLPQYCPMLLVHKIKK